ncbi:MAG: ATP-binding protein [Pseudomonadota bacterium]
MAASDSKPRTPRTSFAGPTVLFVGIVFTLATLAAAWLAQRVTPWWLAWLLSLIVGLAVIAFALDTWWRRAVTVIDAVASGADSLRDADFSVTIARPRGAELAALVASHNRLGEALRTERQTLYQRELMLDTVIQATDIALVLCNSADRIVYSNAAARQLLNRGRPVNGEELTDLLSELPTAFRTALDAGGQGLFTVDGDEPQTYHVSQSEFMLNAQRHQLTLLKQLTQELNRQEVATWKKVIRLISHELNNSLAPISSLAHSGRKLIEKHQSDPQLDGLFATIGERAKHLQRFIEGYARFARLPTPRLSEIEWVEFLATLQATVPFEIEYPLPSEPASVDPVQFEQVMINLLKNAHESGSTPETIVVAVRQRPASVLVTVRDSGGGLTDDVLQHALLPFYSTKKTGTGLGLPLCREIIEAHGGRLSLANVEDGLEVRIVLPIGRSAST